MLSQLSNIQNSIVFLVSAVIIWYFSNKLSGIVDFIDNAFGLGDAFGGTILLSIITNLPELVIMVTGVIKGDTSLALGNILGGIAIQTILLCLFDFASRKEQKPLMTLTSHKNSIAQGLFLCIILALVIMGSQFNAIFVTHRVSPMEVLIALTWIMSLLVLKRSKTGKAIKKQVSNSKNTKKSALLQLLFVAIIILFFGVLLAVTSDSISKHYNWSGVIFGATILAIVTSLPEISGGLAFVKKKEYVPIIGDIFGGNAFLPVLFLLANLMAGRSILTDAHKTDIYLTSLSIILVAIFVIGMVMKAQKRKAGLGIDSWAVLIVYLIGIIGLTFI